MHLDEDDSLFGGLSVGPSTESLRAASDIPSDVEGVIVTAVE